MSHEEKRKATSRAQLTASRALLVLLYPLMLLECLFEAMGTPRWFFLALRVTYRREFARFMSYWRGEVR